MTQQTNIHTCLFFCKSQHVFLEKKGEKKKHVTSSLLTAHARALPPLLEIETIRRIEYHPNSNVWICFGVACVTLNVLAASTCQRVLSMPT